MFEVMPEDTTYTVTEVGQTFVYKFSPGVDPEGTSVTLGINSILKEFIKFETDSLKISPLTE